MEKERVENFRYQQRAKELEKAVTPFLKVRFQNLIQALIGHLVIQPSFNWFLNFQISTIWIMTLI